MARGINDDDNDEGVSGGQGIDDLSMGSEILGRQWRMRRCNDRPEELVTTTNAFSEEDEPEVLTRITEVLAEEAEETTRPSESV